MSYSVKPANPWGRLGASIGQGLAEQVPKEVERTRLSSGLKELGKKESSGNAYDQISELLSIPGMTEQKAQILFPYLQKQIAKNELAKRAGGQSTQPQQNINTQNVAGSPSIQSQAQTNNIQNAPANQVPFNANQVENQPNQLKTIITPESVKNAQEVFVPLNYQQRIQEKNRLIQENPASFPDDATAEQEVERLENLREKEILAKKAGYQNLQALQNSVIEKFDNRAKTIGVTDRLPVEILASLRDRAEDEIANGGDLEQVTRKYADKALALDKDLTTVDRIGASWGLKNADSNIETLKSIGEIFRKEGFGELYVNYIQASQNLSPNAASEIVYPIKNNRKLYEEIKSLPDKNLIVRGAVKNLIDFTGIGPSSRVPKKEMDKISKELAPLITKDSSLLNTAMYLDDKGYSSKDFMDYIEKQWNLGNISLSKEQQNELKKPHQYIPTLGDLFYRSQGLFKPIKSRKK